MRHKNTESNNVESKQEMTTKTANQFGSGKVVLAAIVHSESLQATNRSPDASGGLQQGGGDLLASQGRQGRQRHQSISANKPTSGGQNTHVKSPSSSSSSISTSFARLFWSKKQRKGNPNSNNNNNGDKKGSLMSMNADCRPSDQDETTFSCGRQSDVTLNAAHLSTATTTTTSATTTTTTTADILPGNQWALADSRRLRRRHRQSQVIEFKFDLIVEEESREAAIDKQPGDSSTGEATPNNLRKRQQQQQQRKLLDNVNELVESFVLDSNDVCLMSIGSSPAGQQTDDAHHHHQFDYICQLAERVLNYSFELLQVTRQVSRRHTGQSGQQLIASNVGLDVDVNADVDVHFDGHLLGAPNVNDLSSASQHDVELSLFMGDNKDDHRHDHHHQDDYCIELAVVLFRQRSSSRPTTGPWFEIVDLLEEAECPGDTLKSVECRSSQEALINLAKARQRLASVQADEPDSQHKNLVAINLKLKQKANDQDSRWPHSNKQQHLFTNRLSLVNFDPNLSELQSIFECVFNGQALAHLKRRQIHLDALVQLEQTTKQPNQADQEIKQHHHVASLRKLIQAEWFLYKQLSSALIKTLLVVHVHKMVAPSGNHQHHQQEDLIIASKQQRNLMDYNLSVLEFARLIKRAASSRLKRRKRHLKSHLSNLSLSSPNEPFGGRQQEASPVYLAPSSCVHGRRSSRDLYVDELTSSMGRRRHHNHHHHHHQRHRRRAHLTGPRDELEESSSVSTGSCRQPPHNPVHRAAHLWAPCRSPLAIRANRHLSDTDSVTSANLNSCSSSSFNRSRRDVELRWLAKQSHLRGHQADHNDDDDELAAIVNRRLVSGASPTCSSASEQRPVASNNLADEGDVMDDDDDDDLNSIAGEVAEPPKQLKLEEFLTQLTSIIAPAKQVSLGARQAAEQPSGEPNEDEEDCKSHSSILDHLSSLALESSNKLQRHNGHQQMQQTGHLQRILKDETSRMLRCENPKSVEDRLRALSIDCAHNSPSSPTASGSSTATFGSSMDSACCSSSSSSDRCAAGQVSSGLQPHKQLISAMTTTTTTRLQQANQQQQRQQVDN